MIGTFVVKELNLILSIDTKCPLIIKKYLSVQEIQFIFENSKKFDIYICSFNAIKTNIFSL